MAPSHGGGHTVRFLNAGLFHVLLDETPWTVDYDACDADDGCMMCGKHFVEACAIVMRKKLPSSRASIVVICERLMQYFVDRVVDSSCPGLSNWISVSSNAESTFTNARRAISSDGALQRLTKEAANKAIGKIIG